LVGVAPRVLILGGTVFLGVALTHELLARGCEVTHFNRGRREAPGNVRSFTGDRALGFESLERERFDAVVDTSGYYPRDLVLSAGFFASRASRYVFVSSISVYDTATPEIVEASPMPPLPGGASETEMTPETYGPLKAACERIVAETFGEAAVVVRPGLIVGPHDPTDRFTYWPLRFARGGEVLAPGLPDRPIQIVDVRDLARFIAGAIEREASGDFNVVSPPSRFTMGGVMRACAEAAALPSSVSWVDDAFLLSHGVEPWSDLPLWIPPADDVRGFYNCNVSKALAAGLTIRPLEETARDTLAWAQTRPPDYQLKAGITAERERDLLAARHRH
jgi:nucleoside-diphosphate-sugar epimerase